MTRDDEKAKLTIREASTSKEYVYYVRKGLGFQAICTKHNTPIEFDCREADCGICIFKVINGDVNLSPQTLREKDFLKAMKASSNERLACQSRIFGDLEIEIEDFGPVDN